MTAFGLVALAAALVLAPAPASGLLRLAVLERAGRLATRTSRRRGRAWSRPTVRAGPAVFGSSSVSAVAVGASAGLPLGVAAAAAVATVGAVGAAALARRRRVARRRALIGAVRLLAAELQAGGRPAAALAGCAAGSREHAEEFGAAAAAAASGEDVGAVFAAAGGDLLPLAHAWRVVDAAGAPLVDVLGRLVGDLTAAEDQSRAVTVALAGPRSSTALLAALPVLGVGLGLAMGAEPIQVLFGRPAGQLLCGAGVLLDAAGVTWTQWLMRRADPA